MQQNSQSDPPGINHSFTEMNERHAVETGPAYTYSAKHPKDTPAHNITETKTQSYWLTDNLQDHRERNQAFNRIDAIGGSSPVLQARGIDASSPAVLISAHADSSTPSVRLDSEHLRCSSASVVSTSAPTKLAEVNINSNSAQTDLSSQNLELVSKKRKKSKATHIRFDVNSRSCTNNNARTETP
jgi:hypothetical protein